MLLTDQRMPGESGVELLDKARRLDPHILRILVTAYSDVETAIDSVNTGAVFHSLTKPWDPEILEGMLKRCLEYFAVQSQRDHLRRQKDPDIPGPGAHSSTAGQRRECGQRRSVMRLSRQSEERCCPDCSLGCY